MFKKKEPIQKNTIPEKIDENHIINLFIEANNTNETNKIIEFINYINDNPPNIYVLNSFASFVKDAEFLFMYDNSKANRIYSSNGYNPGENGFVVNDDKVQIIVKVYMKDQKIGININRKTGSKINNEITFINRNTESLTDAEYQLLIHINKIMMHHMSNMLESIMQSIRSYNPTKRRFDSTTSHNCHIDNE